MTAFSRLVFLIWVYLLIIPISFASDANPVYKSEVENNADFLINNWEELPFKDIRALDPAYINWVNNTHGQSWDSTPFPAPNKCLSYSAATMNDWYRLQIGKPLGTYQNYVNNRTENGTNPRVLEAIYLTHNWWESYYDFIFVPDDPITDEPMPYDIKGYADILSGNYLNWINQDDELLGSDYKLTSTSELYSDLSHFNAESFLGGHWLVSPSFSQIKNLVDRYGGVYAQIETVILPVHSATIIGYGNFDCDRDGDSEDIFFLHETYSDEWNGSEEHRDTRYKCIEAGDISEVLSLYDPQWPTYHHDNRRTGFTLLKGNLKKTDNPKSWNYVLTSDIESDALARPSIADIDKDGDQEVIVTFNRGITYYNGTVVALRKVFGKTKEYWSQQLSTSVSSTPSIGNTDNDDELEVVMGVGQGKVSLFDTDGDAKWLPFTVSPKFSSYAGEWYRGKVDYTAIADIDNDGKGEIIFTDYYEALYDWKGTLYVLNDNGNTYSVKATIDFPGDGDGGAQGAPAIANLDNDDNLEIVVPGYYGIKVYDVNELKGDIYGF